MQNKILFFLGMFLSYTLVGQAETGTLKIGDKSDGSQSNPVHLIQIFDEDSAVVWSTDRPQLPFSTANTCGKCHDYNKIMNGWHFNAGNKEIDDGRPGHPWLYVDKKTGTQIPMSLRDWKGVFKPQDLGMTAMEFIQEFGRQMPGGGIGENEDLRPLDDIMRWDVTGNIEINCLSCHSANHAQDQAEYADQLKKQNFRWAATAASGIAKVLGSAKELPINYDIYRGEAPDLEHQISPHVYYNVHNFNQKQEVFFDLAGKSPNDRCYFCHSTIEAETEKWEHSGDVHIQAGMLCVDCHKNGLDHAISRSYQEKGEEIAGTETCEECHFGNGDHKAPRPEHDGMPIIHFTELTCTACHSGPIPKDESIFVKTSMGHALGVHGSNKSGTALPHIISPVFSEDADGKIAPYNLIWPSYWGTMTGDSIQPLNINSYSEIISSFIENTDTLLTGSWVKFNENTVKLILDSLISTNDIAVESPVFVSGGKVYQIDAIGQLITIDHAAAKPYSWAIAHDVRPARQSLGVNSCSDCHAVNAPFYFGRVLVDTPVDSIKNASIRMTAFEKKSAIGEWVFSFTFFFRPWLKIIIMIGVFVIFAVLIIYAFRGLGKLTIFLSQKD